MIGRLQGILLEIQAPEILVDVRGVAYEVFVPMTTLYQLPQPGSEVSLLTHFSVSENAQTLYGFYSKRDRNLFRTLIKVNGVGPKLALAILSGLEAPQLVSCVLQNNVAALVKVPGVGRKTAERLVVELRDRLQDWGSTDAPGITTAGAEQPARPAISELVAEAESALVALGYKPTEAARVINSVSEGREINRSEDLIRLALKSLVPA